MKIVSLFLFSFLLSSVFAGVEILYTKTESGYNNVKLSAIVKSSIRPDYIYYNVLPHNGIGGEALVNTTKIIGDLWKIEQKISIITTPNSGNPNGVYRMRYFNVAYHLGQVPDSRASSKTWIRKKDLARVTNISHPSPVIHPEELLKKNRVYTKLLYNFESIKKEKKIYEELTKSKKWNKLSKMHDILQKLNLEQLKIYEEIQNLEDRQL